MYSGCARKVAVDDDDDILQESTRGEDSIGERAECLGQLSDQVPDPVVTLSASRASKFRVYFRL